MLAFIHRHKLLLVLTLALLVRGVILFSLPQIFRFEQTGAVHGSDAYDAYAQNLLTSGIYGRVNGVPDAMIPPGYSYVLAGVYALIGRGGVQVGLVHTALDLLSIALLYHIGRRLFTPDGEWIGTLAGVCYALYPYLVFQNLTLIDTPLFMVILFAFLLVMISLRERPTYDRATFGYALLGGVILGVSMLVRPILPPLAVLVAVWFLFRLNVWQTVTRLLPVALIGVGVVLGWTVRNYGVFQQIVPLTATSGANFWQGNSPYTVPYFRAGYDVQWTSPDTLQATDRNSLEADAERFALGWEYLQTHPERIPELLWVKFLVHWSVDIAPRRNPTAGELPRLDYAGNVLVEDATQLELGGLPQGDPVDAYSEPLFDRIGRAVHRVYFGGLLALCLVGMGLSVRQWRSVSLLVFTQVSMTALYMLFHPSTRYRVPTDPLLFLFSAVALLAITRWIIRPRKQPTP